MFGNHFYHERVRRSVGVFGSLFNNINIIRKEKSGKSTSQVRVPLSYAPKRKFIDEIRERGKSDLQSDRVIAITLPRMSFEIIGLNYDPSRQLPKMNSCIMAGGSKSTRGRMYTKTPYNVQFQLSIYTKSHDDALQIVEQIFPYFTPQYTISMRPLDEYPSVVDDVPIILNGVSFSDDYEGPIEMRRTIIYTLDFEMKLDFYGPTTESKIIESAQIDFFLENSVDPDADFTHYATYNVTTDPSPVGPDSDYTFVESFKYSRDSDS